MGWEVHSGCRSEYVGAMYVRTGSFRRSRWSIVLIIWGGISIDIVARSC